MLADVINKMLFFCFIFVITCITNYNLYVMTLSETVSDFQVHFI